MEFHHLFETSADEIQHEIEDIAKHVSNAYPQASPITVDPINAYPGLQINPSDATVLWATKLAEASGSTKVSFGTEAGFFVSLGLTTVVIGPGNMVTDGHQPDEGLSKADLLTCDVMLNNILSELTV
jgi:acetylornithine deacetylase